MEYKVLPNGVKVPILGYGVYQVTPEECEKCVAEALKIGYRHIDTAQAYSNEEGETINEVVLSLSSEEKKKQFKPAFKCDRIAYSDDARTLKTNSWLSEAYCINGRYQITHNSSSVCFFEYKVM